MPAPWRALWAGPLKTPLFLIGLVTPTTTTHLNIHLFKWAERHSCWWHALQREGTAPPNQRLKLSHTKADTHDVATFLRNVRPPAISSVLKDSQGTITFNSGHACRFWTNFFLHPCVCVPQMHSEPCHNNFGKFLTAIATNASFPVPSCSLRILVSANKPPLQSTICLACLAISARNVFRMSDPRKHAR